MKEIRAFVGHSFTKDDEDVVHIFLKYFDQLSRSQLNFSWEHAEIAEPETLDKKVMSLIDNKNVFIGICTRKEAIYKEISPKKKFLNFLQTHDAKYELVWKTSDWIIQEIGLAKGRGLELILLIEKGVRQPGGLQGNIEYISFDRSAPEQSFGKVLEMITALSPKNASSAVASTGNRDAEVEEDGPRRLEGEWATPKPDWNTDDYAYAFTRMLLAKNETGAAFIYKAYLGTDEASSSDKRIEWDARCEYLRLTWGLGGSLEKLKELAEKYPNNSSVLICLAASLEKFESYGEAAQLFENASSKALDPAISLKFTARAAACYLRDKNTSATTKQVNQMKQMVKESRKGKEVLLNTLKTLAEIAEDNEASIASMECLIDANPDDINTRFQLAYKYSQMGNNDLALYHYLKIPYGERDSMMWNNLGVAYDAFSLSTSAVDAYKKAEDADETLAMSNLANKLLAAGFLTEAQQRCDRALSQQDYHKNIPEVISSIKETPEAEAKKENEILASAKPISDFYREFGKAMLSAEPSILPQRCKEPSCILDITLNGLTVRAVGSYEVSPSGLGALLGAFGGTFQPEATTTRWNVEYKGPLKGRTIEGRVIRKRESAPHPLRVSTILDSNENESKVLMILSEDGSEFRVMEKSQGSTPRFYSLPRESA